MIAKLVFSISFVNERIISSPATKRLHAANTVYWPFLPQLSTYLVGVRFRTGWKGLEPDFVWPDFHQFLFPSATESNPQRLIPLYTNGVFSDQGNTGGERKRFSAGTVFTSESRKINTFGNVVMQKRWEGERSSVGGIPVTSANQNSILIRPSCMSGGET